MACVSKPIRVLLLASFIAGHIGFPILVAPEGSTGAAFPCEGHQCGCQSAEHCWSSCCCMPSSERLAWAKRNQVVPPILVASSAVNEPIENDDCDWGGNCCTKPNSEKSDMHAESSSRVAWQWGNAWQQMKCRGHSPFWSAAAEPALVSDNTITCQLDFAPAGVIQTDDEFLESWRSIPPVPPG